MICIAKPFKMIFRSGDRADIESFQGGFCPWENLFLLIYLPPFTPPE
jgi:hypothetical protein